MAIDKSAPMRFTPRGLVDAFDSTDTFAGACQRLQNLIFDQRNPELVVSRPGVTQLVDLAAHAAANNTWGGGALWGPTPLGGSGGLWGAGAGLDMPGFISVHIAIGTRIYGMVATDRFPGSDEPFCYDTATGTLLPISGVFASNVPASPSTSGEWVPPTMTTVGTMVLVTHPGFTGIGSDCFGMFDLTDPSAPAWSARNTAVNPLPSAPQAVANFNNRAYFAVGNYLYFTDALTNPPTITVASQFLVIGDSGDINALVGLPVQTTSSGVLQTLTVFKSTQVWQVSGDLTANNLALNYVSLTVGTNAPRSVVQTPYGLYFATTGGPYQLDPLGTLRLLTHSVQETNPDLQAPFQNAIDPSRWAGAYNSTVYRVCGATSIRGIESVSDYWFDERKRRWNGPHSFAYDCASALGGYFVLSSANVPGQLIQSYASQVPGFVATDLGSLLSIQLQTSTFPKVDWMAMKQVAESQIELAANTGVIVYTITAQDEQGATLGQARVAVSAVGGVWGYFIWGDGTLWTGSNLWGGGALWGSPPVGSGAIWGAGAQAIPHTFPVPWPAPLVFEKMQLLIDADVPSAAAIGTFYARYQKTGYMTIR